MIRSEHSHRYKCKNVQSGEGIFSTIANKVATAITSDVSKKFIRKTVDSIIDNGSKKAGEFIVNQISKRPGDLIKEHLATMRKPPTNEEEKYLQDAIDRILLE